LSVQPSPQLHPVRTATVPCARIPTVQGLRGLAALVVVFDHVVHKDWGLWAWSQQNHGITLFALLTGFLLSAPFLRARLEGRGPPGALGFLRARAARIYPGYWVALAGAALLIGLQRMGPNDLWQVITLTQTFGTDTPFEGLLPAWSLSLFLSFYVAIPAWSWWRRRADPKAPRSESILRREAGWLLLVVLLAWVVRTTEVTDPIAKQPYYTLPGRADWFALGMLLAVLTAAHARGLAPRILLLPGRHPGLAWLAALGLTIASALIPVHFEELRDQLDTFAAAALIAGAVLVGPVLRGPQRWLATRPAQAIGRWSYGIFLWGYIVQKALEKLIPGISTAPHLLLTLLLAVALGAASWKFVEEPASRRLGKRRSKDPKARPKLPRLETPAATSPSQAGAR
jgi:peptidoglycan/LPS O-acetylase OafA/YrhL